MKKSQGNVLTMMIAVLKYIIPFFKITDVLPYFKANATLLAELVASIQSDLQLQITSLEGYINEIKLRKKALIAMAKDTAIKLEAYASLEKNQTLLAIVSTDRKKISNAHVNDLKEYAQNIYDHGQAYIGDLGPYGITATSQTSFLNMIKGYGDLLGQTSINKANHEQIIMNIKAHFAKAKLVLADMDSAVGTVKTTESDFYNGYILVRKVLSTGTGSLSVKMQFQDAETALPLKNVTAILTLVSKGNLAAEAEPIVRKSADKGGVWLQNTPDGTYKLKAKLEGYADNDEETVVVKSGTLAKVTLKMVKNKK